ncbi:Hypothetical protein FKW44_013697 [Caligus rogercresseyi]|uniref:Uncharacterized protein n=1 Tax=Caligus rogercresseyi TaxID=217165 RepID=A0A7T8JYI0_CALRO|nr:Hypothetical protein FKW44_013697 [Caligus rogercresseyi]
MDIHLKFPLSCFQGLIFWQLSRLAFSFSSIRKGYLPPPQSLPCPALTISPFHEPVCSFLPTTEVPHTFLKYILCSHHQ